MKTFFLSVFAAVIATCFLISPVYAQEPVCDGRVTGLSRTYNPSTGAGFLAVRAGPTSQATQVGELFNGMRVELYGIKGNWFAIYSEDLGQRGWVHRRYVRDNCGW